NVMPRWRLLVTGHNSDDESIDVQFGDKSRFATIRSIFVPYWMRAALGASLNDRLLSASFARHVGAGNRHGGFAPSALLATAQDFLPSASETTAACFQLPNYAAARGA